MRAAAILLVFAVGCGDDSVHHLPDGPPGHDDAAVDARDNHAPIASVGPDRRALVDNRITLAGTGTDLDGDTLTYQWTQTAGPPAALDSATLAAPTFRARAAGTYAFTLVVSDGIAQSAPMTAHVLVHDLNGGENFTLSLEPDGKLWAWGNNAEGELGTGNAATALSSNLPVRVCAPGSLDGADCAASPFTDVVAISTGASHSIALTSDGKVWSWGYNGNGALGTGDYTNTDVPVPVCSDGTATVGACTGSQLSGVIAIAAGYQHSIALKADGTLWAWGYNGDGELGNGILGAVGMEDTFPAPVCAPGATPPCDAATGNILTHVALVAAGGGGHTLALLDTGEVYAFGYNKSGQCGMGDATIRRQPLPTQVCAPGQVAPCTSFMTGIVDLDAWSGHSLGLDATGQLWGWGGNDDGELGQITTDVCLSAPTCNVSPAKVCASYDAPCTQPLANVVSFAAGRRWSIALLADHTIRAWGDDELGQIGDADALLASALAPTPVCAPDQTTSPCSASFTGAVAVSAGSFHALALMPDGAIYAWGNNDFGELGDGSVDAYHLVPGPVAAH